MIILCHLKRLCIGTLCFSMFFIHWRTHNCLVCRSERQKFWKIQRILKKYILGGLSRKPESNYQKQNPGSFLKCPDFPPQIIATTFFSNKLWFKSVQLVQDFFNLLKFKEFYRYHFTMSKLLLVKFLTFDLWHKWG